MSNVNFNTLTRINSLITAGADRDYVAAVCAIWHLQASNDPNTPESQALVGDILGTLEAFFMYEADAVSEQVADTYRNIVANDPYGALFDEAQTAYTLGKKEVDTDFGSMSGHVVMDLYAHYANVMLNTTKQADKENLLGILHALGGYVNQMLNLADAAEANLI